MLHDFLNDGGCPVVRFFEFMMLEPADFFGLRFGDVPGVGENRGEDTVQPLHFFSGHAYLLLFLRKVVKNETQGLTPIGVCRLRNHTSDRAYLKTPWMKHSTGWKRSGLLQHGAQRLFLICRQRGFQNLALEAFQLIQHLVRGDFANQDKKRR